MRSGHLVYGAAGTLRAVAFDLATLTVIGTAVPIVEEVMTKNTGAVGVAVAGDGTVVYVPGVVGAAAQQTLVWVDREGDEEPLKAAAGAYANPRLSPDGTRVALEIRDRQNDIWMLDPDREAPTRLTFDPLWDQSPVWTPDEQRVVFSSGRSGVVVPNMFWQAANGTGTIDRLTQSPNIQHPRAISPDGAWLLFEETTVGTDIMMLTLDKDRRVQSLVKTPFNERNPEISPNGLWLAYESNGSGQYEIHVRPFPDVDSARWVVSTAGGTRPLWARSGQELFYLAPSGALMSVPTERGSTWKSGAPVKLFDWPIPAVSSRSYDVSPDGQRFLMLKPAGGSESTPAPTSLVVMQHFDEELKRLAPAN